MEPVLLRGETIGVPQCEVVYSDQGLFFLQFVCQFCRRTYGNQEDCDNHERVAHAELPRYNCICGTSFKTESAFKLHYVRQHDRSKPDPVRLEQRKKALLLYSHTCYDPAKCNIRCPECSKCFERKESAYSHISRKHNVKQKSFSCFYCDNEFARPKCLYLHLAKHHSQENYICTPCDRVFQTITSYRQHITKAHMSLHEMGYYKCFKCNSYMQGTLRARNHMIACRITIPPAAATTQSV